MSRDKNIIYVSLLLAFTAGFCDAGTFTAADQLFSAHVTGNFIVFAYDLVKGANRETWVKLISFPVFIVAVMVAGWLAPKLKSSYTLLLIEGIILVISAVLILITAVTAFNTTSWSVCVPFVIVFAMGIQNAFGRLYTKAIIAPTTIMTGNVTQAALDFTKMLMLGSFDKESRQALNKQLMVITAFLTGCVAGALLAAKFGLWVVALPGVLLIILSILLDATKVIPFRGRQAAL